MCGRARCSVSRKCLEEYVGTHFRDVQCHTDDSMFSKYSPSYNISPGHFLPVIVRNQDHNGSLELSAFKWGLVPNFTNTATEKPDHYRMFNCRSEEMQNKPSFKNLVSRNRCIILTEGFYEWKNQHFGEKQPYFVYFGSEDKGDADMMPLAGLFDCWIDRNGTKTYTCTILTTSSNKELSWLHDRMPLILDHGSMASWIDTETFPVPKDILQPYHGEKALEYHKVNPKIGKVSFQGKGCCEEYGKSQKSILSMFHVKKEEPHVGDNGAENERKRSIIPQDTGDTQGKRPKVIS